MFSMSLERVVLLGLADMVATDYLQITANLRITNRV